MHAHLPKFGIGKWQDDPKPFFGANCYNYALDVLSGKYSGGEFMPALKPGELAMRRRLWPDRKKIRRELKHLRHPENLVTKFFDPQRFEKYRASRIAAFIDDGLILLGGEAGFPDNGWPMALFFRHNARQSHAWFRSMDYHWYTLRQDEEGNPFWACKFLNGGVKILAGTSIFTDAFARGYDDFAGYFLRPLDMDV